MYKKACSAEPALSMLERGLQPSILQPCISHPCRMTCSALACYSDITAPADRATRKCGYSVAPLATVSYRSEGSRARRRKPEEAHARVPARMPAPSRRTPQENRVALPGLDHSVGSPRTRRSRTTPARPQDIPADQQTGATWQNIVGVCRQNSYQHDCTSRVLCLSSSRQPGKCLAA